MKLLLDECVVQDFRHEIVGHDVRTVAYMRWDAIKNGELLALAAAFVTMKQETAEILLLIPGRQAL